MRYLTEMFFLFLSISLKIFYLFFFNFLNVPLDCIWLFYAASLFNFQKQWTPTGRRLITGSQTGEFTLWNGQSFNFEMILQVHDFNYCLYIIIVVISSLKVQVKGGFSNTCRRMIKQSDPWSGVTMTIGWSLVMMEAQ